MYDHIDINKLIESFNELEKYVDDQYHNDSDLVRLVENLGDYGLTWKWEPDSNPYYHPEKVGLELLSVIQEHNLSYEFNMVIVVKDKKSGEIYIAHDSGCSCPSPFERIGGLHDMTKIEKMSDFDNFFDTDYGSIKRLSFFDVMKARKIVEENFIGSNYFI